MGQVLRELHVGGSAVRLVRYAPMEYQAWHRHERASITLVLRGRLSEAVGGVTAEASALSVVFKPAGVLHADRVGDHGASLVQIELGRSDETAVQAAGGALLCWRWEHATSIARPMVLLAMSLICGSTGDTRPHLHGVLQEMAGSKGLEGPTPRPWLVAATSRLESRRAAVREVASAARVHPAYFARAFRRCFGETPLGYRGRHRLREAASRLTDTTQPLADVALDTGFADQAHMTRNLKRRIGLTPRTLRLLAHAAGSSPPP